MTSTVDYPADLSALKFCGKKVVTVYDFIPGTIVKQASFGWHDMHLYDFSPRGMGTSLTITRPDFEPETEYKNNIRLALNKCFGENGDQIMYTYDYGDSWEQLITLENILQQKSDRATCIAGEGTCPPEDCGGVNGFREFKAAVNNPAHEDYEATHEWALMAKGEIWDAHEFDLERTQRILKSM